SRAGRRAGLVALPGAEEDPDRPLGRPRQPGSTHRPTSRLARDIVVPAEGARRSASGIASAPALSVSRLVRAPPALPPPSPPDSPATCSQAKRPLWRPLILTAVFR